MRCREPSVRHAPASTADKCQSSLTIDTNWFCRRNFPGIFPRSRSHFSRLRILLLPGAPLKLLQKSHIILVKQPGLVDLVPQHCHVPNADWESWPLSIFG